VTDLPPGPLLSQFGPEGKRIWQLARGQDDAPLHPRSFEETIEESAVLPSVTISLDSMLVAVEALLIRAFARDLKGRGIRSLMLWAKIWPSGYWEKSIKFKEPAMNTKKALSRIKPMLENSPPPGPVEELGLKLTGLGASSGRQSNLLTDIRAQDHLLNDIRQLEFRLGGPQVFKIKELEPWSRIPERRRVLAPISQ
jgi:DNA polymerase-4/protein ImuB